MQEVSAIKKQFKKFWRRMKSKYKNLEYLYVLERASKLHIHMFIKDANEKSRLYIDNDEIEAMWEEGTVVTKRITEINGLINYFIKIKQKDFKCNEKIYSKSRGIKKPEKSSEFYGNLFENANKKYNFKKGETVIVRNEETDAIMNLVQRETWKEKR